MIEPAVFICEPLKFKKDILVYPPSVRKVINDEKFGQYIKLLTISQEDLQDELSKKEQYTNIPTPFEFLLINCYHHEEFCQAAKEAFRFFIKQEVHFFYEQKIILIGKMEQTVLNIKDLSDLKIIGEDDYFDFQNIIRKVVGEKEQKPPAPLDPNEDPRIARIKAKARERDRIKARKGTAGGISFITSMTAICCMGVGITPLNIGEMSYASIQPMMKMLQSKEKYEIDIQSLLAGADSKKIKPKYWIRNFE